MKSNFGEYLRNIRKQSDISIRKLAELVNVNYTYISKIENGQLNPPSEDVIVKIANILMVDSDNLMVMADKIPNDIIKKLLEKPGLFDVIRKF